MVNAAGDLQYTLIYIKQVCVDMLKRHKDNVEEIKEDHVAAQFCDTDQSGHHGGINGSQKRHTVYCVMTFCRWLMLRLPVKERHNAAQYQSVEQRYTIHNQKRNQGPFNGKHGYHIAQEVDWADIVAKE